MSDEMVPYKRPPLKRDAKVVAGSVAAGYVVAKLGLLAPLLGWVVLPAAVIGGSYIGWKIITKKKS